MKKRYFIILFAFVCHFASAQMETTYYFIRHAEKNRNDTTNKDPKLIKKGKRRAVNWANTFENVDFDAIYSTRYKRTKATAKPTARRKNIKVTLYDPKTINYTSFKENTKNKTVLIVGHSGTTPKFVNAIIGKDKYESIDDRTNSHLYIVRIKADGVISDELKVVN